MENVELQFINPVSIFWLLELLDFEKHVSRLQIANSQDAGERLFEVLKNTITEGKVNVCLFFIDWLIDRLIDRLVAYLIDWLIDWFNKTNEWLVILESSLNLQ